MKKALATVLVLIAALAADGQTTNAPVKVIAIINAAGVKPDMLQAIEESAEKSLNVPFETVTIPPIAVTNLLAAHAVAATRRNDRYAAMVMLVNATTTVVSHASYNTNAAISIVNVTAMREANPDIVRARLQKQVIRGAVFAFGIPPSDDPLCVSRDYRTLEEFDMMPAVLFPPWQDRFETLASSRQIAVQDPPLRKRIFNKNTP